MPLGTRLIGGFLLLWGLLALNGVLQALVFGREPTLDWNVGLVLVGWGLLRGREWARMLSILGFALSALMAIVLLAENWFRRPEFAGFNSLMGAQAGRDPQDLLVLGAMALGSGLAIRHLMRSSTKAAHFAGGGLQPFIVWNPKCWRFGIWTWALWLPAMAWCALAWGSEPAVQKLGFRMGLVSFPSYLDGLPELPVERGAPFEFVGELGGGSLMICYGYHPSAWNPGSAKLDFVVLGRAEGSLRGPAVSYAGGPTDMLEARLTLGDGRKIPIPDRTQLFELNEGELTRSEMHITFPEFWHYLHTTEESKTLRSLEEHVKALRLQFGE